ncbi:MAG: DUF4291 domain-containing protein [Myxococcota bacterium]
MLEWEPYDVQAAIWPRTGRHILAQYDDTSVIVYQAYRDDIADHAVTHQAFGGPWSFDRMSWIKPNFLWMMYRSGWATKPGQERVLAIRISREAFDTILRRSVESTHHPEVTGWDRDEWRRRGQRSDVRLQWDPDHHPSGPKLERRAVQLGLRRDTLARFATDWILRIHDLTDEVHARHLDAPLLTPRERVYRPDDPELCRWLRLADVTPPRHSSASTP